MDAFSAVDRFMWGRYGVRLEDVLCESCLSGRVSTALEDDVAITRCCTHVQADDDGGRSFTFEGVFVLMNARYRFRCYIFADAGGQRFLSDVATFELSDWSARVAI